MNPIKASPPCRGAGRGLGLPAEAAAQPLHLAHVGLAGGHLDVAEVLAQHHAGRARQLDLANYKWLQWASDCYKQTDGSNIQHNFYPLLIRCKL